MIMPDDSSGIDSGGENRWKFRFIPLRTEIFRFFYDKYLDLLLISGPIWLVLRIWNYFKVPAMPCLDLDSLPIEFSVTAIVLALLVYRQFILSPKDVKANYFGLRWTWSYGFFGKIRSLRAWCPECRNTEVVFGKGSILTEIIGHSDNLLCSVCGYNSESSENFEPIPFRPHREVIRRIECERIRKKYA